MSMVHCRGCGHQIHSSAPTCPKCGAPQALPTAQATAAVVNYTTYTQVPWFRKWWFTVLCFLLFSPAMWVIFATGDVFYEKNGTLEKFSPTRKMILVGISVGLMVMAILG